MLEDEAPLTPLLVERVRGETQLFVKEIAQQVGPFDGEAVALAQVGQLFCSIRARNEQNTWPRMAASEE